MNIFDKWYVKLAISIASWGTIAYTIWLIYLFLLGFTEIVLYG